MNDRELVYRAENELALMTPDQIVELHRKAETVARYCARVHEAIKSHVERNGDVVGKKHRLTIETQGMRSLNTMAAWPVLEGAGFGDEEMARVIDLRISRVEAVVREKAGKGGGAAAVRELDTKLRKAGAVETSEKRLLKEKRT